MRVGEEGHWSDFLESGKEHPVLGSRALTTSSLAANPYLVIIRHNGNIILSLIGFFTLGLKDEQYMCEKDGKWKVVVGWKQCEDFGKFNGQVFSLNLSSTDKAKKSYCSMFFLGDYR